MPNSSELVGEVDPSVVQIVAERVGVSITGSGFLVGDSRTIVTNYHVLSDAEKAHVVFSDGSTSDIEGVLAVDETVDLMAVQIGPVSGNRKPLVSPCRAALLSRLAP